MNPDFPDFYKKPEAAELPQQEQVLEASAQPVDYYAANLEVLKTHQPVVYEKIIMDAPDPAGEIISTASGRPNLRMINDKDAVIYLHDNADPAIETGHFLKMVPEKATGVVSLVGMGLGYTMQALLTERTSIRHLFVFDLHPGIFMQALHALDLSAALSDPRLTLCIDPEPDVEKVFPVAARALQLETIHTLKHLPSINTAAERYEKLLHEIFSCVNEYNVAGTTVAVFGKHFLENRFQHLSGIHYHYLLEDMAGKFKDVPAILVAGGPSLDKNIHLLKQAKDKAVIIAVDTVLPALLQNGVSPDFLTSIDPEPFTHEKFANVIPQIKDVSLVCASWVSPRVPKTFPNNRVFWTFAGNKIESWINHLLGGRMLTAGAKTVAHLNFIAATILGCSTMIFVGQDLAFSNNKDHADSTFLTNQSSIDNFLKNEKDVVWVEGIDGAKVPTNRAFFSMKVQFEKMIANQEGTFINATEGGAHIEGTRPMTLTDALNKYCSQPRDISDFINRHIQNTRPRDMKKLLSEFRSVAKQIGGLKRMIHQADKTAADFLSKLETYEKNGSMFQSIHSLPKSMQEQLCKIDECHNSLDEHYRIWQLLEEVTMDGIRTSDRLRHDINLLENDPAQYTQWLRKGLERLDRINRVRLRVITHFHSQLSHVLSHHKKERKLKKQLKGKSSSENTMLQLAELYLAAGDVVPAREILEKLLKKNPQSAKALYQMGCVYTFQGENSKTDAFFSKAASLSPQLSLEIDRFRKKIGAEYESHIKRLKQDGYDLKKMALRGLRFCWENATINEELSQIVGSDLKQIEEAMAKKAIQGCADLICTWHAEFGNNPYLLRVIDPETIARLYMFHGNLMVAQNQPQEAVPDFQKALKHSPNNPDIRIFLADAFFTINRFDDGIRCIQEAVAIDRNYAAYWENIGDNLQRAEQFNDAIIAYEQCFTSLPERCDLLKKIGDCYRMLGRDEAALAVYQHLKDRLAQDVCQPTGEA